MSVEYHHRWPLELGPTNGEMPSARSSIQMAEILVINKQITAVFEKLPVVVMVKFGPIISVVIEVMMVNSIAQAVGRKRDHQTGQTQIPHCYQIMFCKLKIRRILDQHCLLLLLLVSNNLPILHPSDQRLSSRAVVKRTDAQMPTTLCESASRSRRLFCKMDHSKFEPNLQSRSNHLDSAFLKMQIQKT
ncbi:conserved hypothetical protein [Trichinella spiralis]|uniref:hypothetical protein n=1 Tax=Trichinella spiralis TaxID=6334 RepID=UPI0001EFE8E0|nr:conserved hypothetical protein [Trichinella spiralis]